MFSRLSRLTPDYIRLLQTKAYPNTSVAPPAEKTMGMALLLGAMGIVMCGYSSRELALYRRPSARVLQRVGMHIDASTVGTIAHKTLFLDVSRRTHACHESSSFVGQKIPLK